MVFSRGPTAEDMKETTSMIRKKAKESSTGLMAGNTRAAG